MTFKHLYERMIVMLLGFVFFAGVFEFAGMGIAAKIVLSLLFDCALWGFVFRAEIRRAYYAVIHRRRRDAELRARACAERIRRAESENRAAKCTSYYYF
ncbi:MAG: hypothetical protein IJN63_06555 [Clostridia bacterium]|nr:hypothetical protein [Clostridia bacterium]